LKQVVAQRFAESGKESYKRAKSFRGVRPQYSEHQGDTPLAEVREIIQLKEFDMQAAAEQQDPHSVIVPENVYNELHHLVGESKI
jgi:hypothetical protein